MVKKCERLKKFRKFVGTILPTQIYENPRVYPCYSLVLTARGVKGMYVIDELHSPSTSKTPHAMLSLSQPTSLEQWHRRLTHCSPLTIKEMSGGNLVDGLSISKTDLRGKCEDCVIGRQTRRAFDGKTEEDLQPLELVSFDLWGPSRVQSAGGRIFFMPVV